MRTHQIPLRHIWPYTSRRCVNILPITFLIRQSGTIAKVIGTLTGSSSCRGTLCPKICVSCIKALLSTRLESSLIISHGIKRSLPRSTTLAAHLVSRMIPKHLIATGLIVALSGLVKGACRSTWHTLLLAFINILYLYRCTISITIVITIIIMKHSAVGLSITFFHSIIKGP